MTPCWFAFLSRGLTAGGIACLTGMWALGGLDLLLSLCRFFIGRAPLVEHIPKSTLSHRDRSQHDRLLSLMPLIIALVKNSDER